MPTAPVAAPAPPPRFVCPGGDVPIDAATHAARLAAGDPRCRSCPLNDGPTAASRRRDDTPVVSDGLIGGRYGITVDVRLAERLGLAFATRLRGDGRPRRLGPLAIACGTGTFAEAIAEAFGRGVRSAGLDTADLGRAAACVWTFGIGHLAAAGGLFVSARSHNDAEITLELATADARPFEGNDDFESLLRDAASPAPSRPTRLGGRATAFDAGVPYLAGLWRHFRQVRPKRLLLRAGSDVVAEPVRRLATGLPFDVRVDGPGADGPPFPARVADLGFDFGVIIDAEGRAVRVFEGDECELSVEMLAFRLAEATARTREIGVLDWRLIDALPAEIDRDPIRPATGTPSAMTTAMADDRAGWGFDASGRLWIADPAPRADVLVGLPRLLAALSLSGGPRVDDA